MNPSLLLRSLALTVLLGAALAAHATLLDFENLTPISGSGGGAYNNLITTNGYTLTTSRVYFAAWTPADVTGNSYSPGYVNYTGLVALFTDYGGLITLTQSGGTAFNLVSIDIARFAKQLYNVGNATVTFTGIFATGGTITQTYVGPLDDPLHTAVFSGFSNLKSVAWNQSGSSATGHQFDNIVVNPVPEPATLAALGLGTVALLRRRRAGR